MGIFSPWYNNCVSPNCHGSGAREAQIDSPHDNGALSAALYELDEVAGCADRQWVHDYTQRSKDNFVLSGADVGGRRLWRLTPDGTADTVTDPSNIPVTLGQPIPGTNATDTPTLKCTLSFESGVALHANESWAESYGTWIVQPSAAGVVLHCPTVASPIRWPIKIPDGKG